MTEMDEPISFADLGIKVTDSTVDTCLGKIRSYKTLSKLEIGFLVISFVSLLGALGLTIERLVTADRDSPDFTFALLLILNICFCIYYVLSGVFFERPYEIGILVLATFVVWLYIVLNYAISVKGPFKLARLVITSVLSPCVIVIGVMLARKYHQSKNLIFRTVGAQSSFQELCANMFVFYDLLKADLQVSWSLALLILSSGQNLDLEDKIFLPISLVLGAASFITAYLAVRFENKVLSVVYAVIWILMPAYAIFLVVKAAKDLQSDSIDTKVSLNAVIFVAAGACVLVRGASAWFGVKAFFNFGKGLKEKVYGVTDGDRGPIDINNSHRNAEA